MNLHLSSSMGSLHSARLFRSLARELSKFITEKFRRAHDFLLPKSSYRVQLGTEGTRGRRCARSRMTDLRPAAAHDRKSFLCQGEHRSPESSARFAARIPFARRRSSGSLTEDT